MLHGMGQHNDGWSKSAISTLKSNAKQYPLPIQFEDHYKFVELRYSDIFDKYIATYQKKSEAIASIIGQLQTDSFVRTIAEELTQEPDTDNFLVTHLGDVALYAATELAELVRTKLASQIISALKEEGASGGWSIIAHSLGTRVIHDTLEAMINNDPLFYDDIGYPTVLMMVSNVSRLMSINENKLWKDSVVHPSHNPNKGACNFYINCTHPLDPFAVIRRFSPPDGTWGYPETFQSGNEQNFIEPKIDNKDITQWNVHDLSHYLEMPLVHTSFFEYSISPRTDIFAVPPIKIRIANEKYRNGRLPGATEDLKTKLENLDLSNISDWPTAYSAVKTYLKLVKEFLN